MKIFEMMDLQSAYQHAQEGGQALHLHTLNQGHRLFKRYPVIAHLLDQDVERLRKTAKSLGVRVIKIEHEGTRKQHIDLCGKPLERARELAERGVIGGNGDNR
ncbi:MAG: hypothetical protein KDK05_03895 [Candidatus Competibacteraceae bacterium]|nr:hypothetical protein [Candidatus Competibacteraceae bacterium]